MARYPGYLKANSWRTVYTERKQLFNHVLAKERPSRESPAHAAGVASPTMTTCSINESISQRSPTLTKIAKSVPTPYGGSVGSKLSPRRPPAHQGAPGHHANR